MDKITKHNLAHIVAADSCGTSNYHIGDPPDSRTRANAQTNGITLKHVGRQLTEQDLEHFDLILAMDRSNLINIMRLTNASTHAHKIKLMRAFDPLHPDGEVPDPYYGGPRDFQEVFDILDRSTHHLLEHIRTAYAIA